jgi:dihydrofolate reductase
MAQLFLDISVSLDGFVAGPNPTLEQPLGEGGNDLHEWAFRLASWRKRHGLDGGVTDADDEVMRESIGRTGAVVMGRRMFSGGAGPWEDDPNADGWWGDDPPFHVPVFVVTHHPRETVTKQGGTTYTFVTEGIEAALKRARSVAGDKDAVVYGGADVIQQSLATGLLDEFDIHVVPIFLGGGVRLFDRVGLGQTTLDRITVVDSPSVTHLRFRVVR